ncbi:hypothetical protein K2173_021173 [Erythroxylum novogranatense]|uniref:Uncharacterized protein n=1 Tax=Erythroxylum novogranatense TaxID=1862640 RepID=A0AAV8TPV0_9ROSI|nr:hypothetical protein K2173_021173 [Erythroxylum novogranatense]
MYKVGGRENNVPLNCSNRQSLSPLSENLIVTPFIPSPETSSLLRFLRRYGFYIPVTSFFSERDLIFKVQRRGTL